METTIHPTPFRTWATDKIAGLMNLVDECVCEDDPYGPITWRDHLRWFLDGWLGWAFNLFYFGSADELEAVLNDEIHEPYLTDRQRAFCAAIGIEPPQRIRTWIDDASSHCPQCEWSDFPELAPDGLCPCCETPVIPPTH